MGPSRGNWVTGGVSLQGTVRLQPLITLCFLDVWVSGFVPLPSGMAFLGTAPKQLAMTVEKNLCARIHPFSLYRLCLECFVIVRKS